MGRPGARERVQAAWRGRGPLAAALLPLAAVYGSVWAARGLLVRLGALAPQALPVPVVVVGNLIAGGAGKTPTVMAVVALLRRHGWHPGVVSRGYGRRGDEVRHVEPDTPASVSGDEPRLLRRRLRVPVVVGRDRVAAAHALLQRHPTVDVLVSDDGLQHVALPREAQVVVFDERGVGNGWLLPAGPLREPMPDRVPPRTLVLYNAPAPTTRWPGHVARRRLTGAVSLDGWSRGEAADPQALDALRGRPVVAAAGMAHPQRFFAMLEEAGLAVQRLPLPDHHPYDTVPWPPGTPDVVVTEKDAVKLRPDALGATRVWVVPLDFDPGPAFEEALLALLRPHSPRIPDGHPTA